MIANLLPYAEYKDSGLSWLVHVPSTWRVVRNGSLFGQRNETGYEELPILEVSLKTGVRVRDFENSTRKQVMSDLGKYKRALKGDVAYNMMRMWQGAVGVSPVDGLVSPAYVVARPYPHVEPRFFVELFRTGEYMSEIDNCSRGIVKDRNRLYWDQFKQILSPCPPAAEQAAIVRFLDWANRRLERAIRAKRKVIALLNEQKQAIIHRAVTRGLDPLVPFKPSGIPWLGDIPQHWEVRKLKHLTRFMNGLPFKPGDWKAAGVPIIRIQNLNGSEAFNYTDSTDLPEELLIQPGDLMFAWSGNRGTSFGSFEWTREFPGYLNQHIFKLVGYSLPTRYFFYLLRAVTRHVEEQAGGIIGLVHVTKPELGSVHVPIAPVDEAEAIAREIDGATTGVERTISRLQREIELLREYRARLVADVVTGKLDVRESAAWAPVEAAAEVGGDAADASIDPEAGEEEAA
jgi:type I restriction enzyme, S subunit